jgi:hypothetical protein
MWYSTGVVRTRVPTAIPATTHPFSPAERPSQSNHCHTSAIFVRNSFVCHSCKTKEKLWVCHPFLKCGGAPPATVNEVPA